jgi:hypothetical protein
MYLFIICFIIHTIICQYPIIYIPGNIHVRTKYGYTSIQLYFSTQHAANEMWKANISNLEFITSWK